MYERQIAQVLRTITKKGTVCTWTKTAATIPDATKPWLKGNAPTVFNNVPILFIPSNKKNYYAQIFQARTDIPSGFLMALLPGKCGFIPTLTDQILRRNMTQSYFIKFVDEVRPADDPILYVLGLAP